jgi:hypothetical protein
VPSARVAAIAGGVDVEAARRKPAFWTMVDPTTLLFTQGHQEGIPTETVSYFIQNEFLDNDVNKWTALARERGGVRTLFEATGGDMDASARYRDIFQPLGLGDELRAVLRIGGACWGYLCLHRGVGAPFSREEVRYVQRLAPHLAEGIRAGLLVASIELADVAHAPGLVVVAPDGSVASMTEAGERWLEELGHAEPDRRCRITSSRSLTRRALPAGASWWLQSSNSSTCRGRWPAIVSQLRASSPRSGSRKGWPHPTDPEVSSRRWRESGCRWRRPT